MKLELKHLAGYKLGKEGIKVVLNEEGLREIWDIDCDNSYLQEPYYIKAIDYDLKVLQLVSAKNENYSLDEIELDWVLLILLPLSDLTKEIEVNGEKFVPIEWLSKKHICFKIKWIEEDKLFEINGELGSTSYLPNFIHRKLIEWHFDIYGLIEKSLAIDINTLN